MRLYNSLSRGVETFRPRSPKGVKLYTCGPTVYARPHIGNLRTYAFEDALKRYLLWQGFRVRHVMNITDIDSTVMRESRKAGIARAALTRKWEGAFRKDCAALGMLPADSYPHVSDYVARMAGNARRLERRGLAYRDGKCRIFFDISKFPSYGKLAGRRLMGQGKVVREEYKPFQAGDFLLLGKCRSKDCEKCFKTGLGMCTPAWNVQCATMATAELGSGIDISMGGQDNLFNHHENTRAVANSLCGHEFSRYYVHVRHVIVDGVKMSKRRGNFVLLPDLLAKGFPARAVRMLLLSVHYRRRLDFTWQRAEGAKLRWLAMRKAVNALKNARGERTFRSEASGGTGAEGSWREGFARFAADARADFEASLEDNMDLPSAIAVAEKFAAGCAAAGLQKKQARAALALLEEFDSVLACLPL